MTPDRIRPQTPAKQREQAPASTRAEVSTPAVPEPEPDPGFDPRRCFVFDDDGNLISTPQYDDDEW